MFDFETFSRKAAVSSKTTIRMSTGHTVRLQGEPDKLTAKELVQLAAEQPTETVRVSLPKSDVAGQTVARSRELKPEDLAVGLANVMGLVKDEKKGKKPSVSEVDVTVGANGESK